MYEVEKKIAKLENWYYEIFKEFEDEFEKETKWNEDER
jgi:hypothetical protein